MVEIEEVEEKLERVKTNLETRMNGSKCFKSGCDEFGSAINASGVGAVYLCPRHISEWSTSQTSMDLSYVHSKDCIKHEFIIALIASGEIAMDEINEESIDEYADDLLKSKRALAEAFIKWVKEPC